MTIPSHYPLGDDGMWCAECHATRYVAFKKTFDKKAQAGNREKFHCYHCDAVMDIHANYGVPTQRDVIRREMLEQELQEAESRVAYIRNQLDNML